MTNLPYIRVFELTQEGKSRQEISDELTISLSQVDRSRACKEYRELKIESNRILKEAINDFRLSQIVAHKNTVLKARKRIDELIDSENEKIALDACKTVLTKSDTDIKAINELDMTELGVMMEEYND